MSAYNISSLIKIMQVALAETQENAGRMILNPVAKQVHVDVTGKMITNLVKRKAEVHQEIKNALTRHEVIVKAEKEIETEVYPKINQLIMDDVCMDIIKTLRGDASVPEKVRNRIQKFYDDDKYLEIFTQAILYALSRDNMLEDQTVGEGDFYFLEEANYKCPLTGHKLWKKVKDQVVHKYRIVQIYPDDLTSGAANAFIAAKPPPKNLDATENLIALCPDCAEAYLAGPTPEEYARLLEKKKMIARIHKGKIDASGTQMEKEIEEVIKAIAGIDKTTPLKPFTDALKLEEKFEPKFYSLKEEMEYRVVKYYPFVEDRFSALDGVGGVSFNVIRSEITECYERCEAAGMNQEEICDELSNWILDRFGFGASYKTAGNIIVSFFIQNCGVFKPVKNKVPVEEVGVEE